MSIFILGVAAALILGGLLHFVLKVLVAYSRCSGGAPLLDGVIFPPFSRCWFSSIFPALWSRRLRSCCRPGFTRGGDYRLQHCMEIGSTRTLSLRYGKDMGVSMRCSERRHHAAVPIAAPRGRRR